MKQSQRIVQFISSLIPLYTYEQVNNVSCARSIVDGTLISPTDLPEENDGFVTVYWQGDPARQSTVPGTFMASYAITKYVELHGMGLEPKAVRDELRHLTRHFTIKTGAGLVLEIEEEESKLLEVLGKAVNKVGYDVLIEVLKKTIGL